MDPSQNKSLRFHICHISINEFDEIYVDLIRSLKGSLEDLGHSCAVTKNRLQANAINIILGSTIFASRYHGLNTRLKDVPYILYQLEHLHDQHGLLPEWPEYYELIKNAHAIWDFSIESFNFLISKGFKNSFYVPPGFHRSLELFVPAKNRDIDVLFIGSPHPRRELIIQKLISRGVNVRYLNKSLGESRDSLIARSRIVLNIHAWDNINTLETIRISFLLANRNFVVSESSDHNPYEDGLVYADYDKLVDTCIYYLAQASSIRESIAFNGYLHFHKIDYATIINECLVKMGGSFLLSCNNKTSIEFGTSSNFIDDISPFIPPGAKNILDIGCVLGQSLPELKRSHECHTLGICNDSKTVFENANFYDAVMCGDINQFLSNIENKKFDCILALGIIKSLDNPESLLKLSLLKLVENGFLILSVPNITHWTVINDLLNGSWQYKDDGIFDKHSLRFFNLESMINLINKTGYAIHTIKTIQLISPKPSEKIINLIKNYSTNGEKILAQSMTYQYVFVLKKQ